MKYTIICVDDESILLNALRQELRRELGKNYLVEVASSAEEALELIGELRGQNFIVPVIISDQLMPGMKGDEFLIRVSRILPRTQKILLSGQALPESAQRALPERDSIWYLQKPWETQILIQTVLEAIAIYCMRASN